VDKSNLWFGAIELERQGRFLEAANLYLRDSKDSLRNRSLVRSALDCSSAATCLQKTGNFADAQKLYVEAGALYEENALTMLNRSVRESLWSLRLSYRCFLLADERNKVREISEKVRLLTERIDPFIEGSRGNAESPGIKNSSSRQGSSSDNVEGRSKPGPLKNGAGEEVNLEKEVSLEVQHFLSFSRSVAQDRAGGRSTFPSNQEQSIQNPGDPDTFEKKSFVNQLG